MQLKSALIGVNCGALALAGLALAGLSAPALAAPVVTVTLGQKLTDKARDLGPRELQDLSADLRQTVERRLAAHPRDDVQAVELTLVDATPNRPTMQQMSRKPGLSYQSFGIGGAQIEGQMILTDGRRLPVSYRWQETRIENAVYNSTWSDAETAFRRVARQVAQAR